MNRTILAVIAVCLLGLGSITKGQAPAQRREFLAVLKAGQAVTPKETAGRFTISTLDDVPDSMSHKVVEVGTDYLTLEDIAGVHQTRIPVYSISSIVRLKSFKK